MGSESMSIQDRVAFEQQILSRTIELIRVNDTKVYIIISFLVGVIAFLSSKGEEVKSVWSSYQFGGLSIILYLSILAFALFVILSGFYAFKSLSPHIKKAKPSLLFFGSILSFSEEKYLDACRGLDYSRMEEEIIAQIYTNSEIAALKFKYVKKSIDNLLYATVSWIISLVLISILS